MPGHFAFCLRISVLQNYFDFVFNSARSYAMFGNYIIYIKSMTWKMKKTFSNLNINGYKTWMNTGERRRCKGGWRDRRKGGKGEDRKSWKTSGFVTLSDKCPVSLLGGTHLLQQIYLSLEISENRGVRKAGNVRDVLTINTLEPEESLFLLWSVERHQSLRHIHWKLYNREISLLSSRLIPQEWENLLSEKQCEHNQWKILSSFISDTTPNIWVKVIFRLRIQIALLECEFQDVTTVTGIRFWLHAAIGDGELEIAWQTLHFNEEEDNVFRT